HPEVLWADRTDRVYLTVALSDAQKAKIDVTKDSIDFSIDINKAHYAFHLDFFKPIKPEETKKSLTGRKIVLVLYKAEPERWNKLVKGKDAKGKEIKPNFLKVDFDHYQDEDESEEE
ncbi:HSP20-like chaperone, partial [Coemansia reversa NRRL 1564]